MSTIRKTPLIETVIGSLTSAQLITLKTIINSSSPANESYSLSSLPAESGVYATNFSAENNKIYTGILIYTDDYKVLIAYHRFQDLLLFKIANGNLEKVNEYCDINELRRVAFAGSSVAGDISGDLTVGGSVLGNDYTYHITTDEFEFTSADITRIGNYDNVKIEYSVGDANELLSKVRVDSTNNEIVFANDVMQIVITYDNEHGTATWEAITELITCRVSSGTITTWTALATAVGDYTYYGTLTFTGVPENVVVELIADNVSNFTTYGFVIGNSSYNNGTLTVDVYSYTDPDTSITFNVKIERYE